MFGGGKPCSVAIALLEQTCLLLKASSANIKARVVGRKMLRTSIQTLSFMALDTCKPVCVQDIRQHGGVHYLLPEHNNDNVSS